MSLKKIGEKEKTVVRARLNGKRRRDGEPGGSALSSVYTMYGDRKLDSQGGRKVQITRSI